MLLAQISDTHFGTEVPAAVQALRRQMQALKPDLLLFCGDITQRARSGQFAAAARFGAELPAGARMAIPGNHDLPLFDLLSRALWPYRGYGRHFGPVESLWTREGIAVAALNATHPARHKDGRLPAAALHRSLAAARAAIGDAGMLVVAAHQPLWTAWEKDRGQTLIDREETAGIFAAQRVDAVLSGHVHVPLMTDTSGPFPSLPWSFVLSGSGTAVSHRTRPGAPNSFNTLQLRVAAVATIVVSRYDLDGARFSCVERREFRRGPRGWMSEDSATALRRTG